MKNIIFITGFYGSGKTEVALNLATKNQVDYLIDLDVINPYFRSREMKDKLGMGIDIISSDLENDQFSDLPYLSKKIFLPFYHPEKKAIYDLGGSDLGAKLIKQFSAEDLQQADLWMVINIFRSETMDEETIVKFIKKVEKESGKAVTGLINNTNLLSKTTWDDILLGEKTILSVSDQLGIPVIYTCVEESIVQGIETFNHPILILKRFFQKAWLK